MSLIQLCKGHTTTIVRGFSQHWIAWFYSNFFAQFEKFMHDFLTVFCCFCSIVSLTNVAQFLSHCIAVKMKFCWAAALGEERRNRSRTNRKKFDRENKVPCTVFKSRCCCWWSSTTLELLLLLLRLSEQKFASMIIYFLLWKSFDLHGQLLLPFFLKIIILTDGQVF